MSDPQSHVELLISACISELREATDPTASARVISSIRRNEPLDYDEDWRAFAVAYLLINYRKALTPLRSLDFAAITTVTDAGCGTGAASLALLTALAERRRPGALTLKLLDRSGPQLPTALNIVRMAADLLGLQVTAEAEHQDIESYAPSEPQNLLLLSHVLLEQHDPAKVLHGQVEASVQARGSVLAIERRDDDPWRHTRLGCAVEYHRGNFTTHAPAPSVTAAETSRSRFWQTAWLVAVKPVPWMRDLVESYCAAWTLKDVDLIRDLFSPTATYHEKPFEDPICGIASITSYWTGSVVPQEVHYVTIANVSYGLLSATFTWEASITDADGEKLLRGMMSMDFDPVAKRIAALREVFRTKVLARQ